MVYLRCTDATNEHSDGRARWESEKESERAREGEEGERKRGAEKEEERQVRNGKDGGEMERHRRPRQPLAHARGPETSSY